MAVRVIATTLAVGGVLWGAFCALFLMGFGLPLVTGSGFPLTAVLAFGPGYLVTLGYLARAILLPPLGVCYLIWGLSLLVQGGWLVYVVSSYGLVMPRDTMDRFTLFWWAFAFAASAVALCWEHRIPRKGPSAS